MLFADVLSAVRELSADERAELVRELTDPPVAEADTALLTRLMPAGSTFEMWSPLFAPEAAAVLQQLLADSREGQ